MPFPLRRRRRDSSPLAAPKLWVKSRWPVRRHKIVPCTTGECSSRCCSSCTKTLLPVAAEGQLYSFPCGARLASQQLLPHHALACQHTGELRTQRHRMLRDYVALTLESARMRAQVDLEAPLAPRLPQAQRRALAPRGRGAALRCGRRFPLRTTRGHMRKPHTNVMRRSAHGGAEAEGIPRTFAASRASARCPGPAGVGSHGAPWLRASSLGGLAQHTHGDAPP